jgi:hypothetical protein
MGYTVKVVKFLGDVNLRQMDGSKQPRKNVWNIKVPGDARATWCKEDRYLQPIRPGRTPVTTETEKGVTA